MAEKKGPEKPLSPEVVTLTEKLVKDPKSRLFVPLAEAYLKAGMLDEAIIILTDGLKIHPNFHAARGTLGKVYLEKGQIAEAKAEFEQVLKADPENLLAHRKLSKLYTQAGETEKARISCQAVLSLNPKDAEMKSLMEELDRLEQMKRQRAEERAAVTMESGSVEMQVEQTSHAQPSPETEPVITEALPAPAEVPPTGAEAPPAAPPSLEEILNEPASGSIDADKSPVVAETERIGSPEPFLEEEPAASLPTEEITTEALADLYVKQGFYEKGIAIYRRLLAKDPSHQALFKKLDETVELVRLLSEGPQIKAESKPAPEAPSPVSSPPPAVSEEPAPAPAEAAPITDRERQKRQKIQRLQSWLDSIKKGQGR